MLIFGLEMGKKEILGSERESNQYVTKTMKVIYLEELLKITPKITPLITIMLFQAVMEETCFTFYFFCEEQTQIKLAKNITSTLILPFTLKMHNQMP